MSASPKSSLRDDLLVGADKIAEFTGLSVRQVYYQRPKLPIFPIGKLLAARKSELMRALSAERDGRAA
jgi:hypothetical protein